jgi:glyceraldehyde 3-phosphate dehydrogenase
MIRVAINGFGRIGRAAFKIARERDDIEVVAINDLGELENLAYLLRYDSVYGRYGRTVKVDDGQLVVDDTAVAVFAEKEPDKLPWGKLNIDVVIESTGFFTEGEGARKHIAAGAKKVIISAPTKDDSVGTVVRGVNDDTLADQDVVSNASCTTNSAAPVVAILDSVFGIEKAILTTVHAYTASQALVDGPAKKDFRGGRAAALSMIPASTGAAIAATQAYPALKGKFDGVSLRVPVPVVSMSDITAVLKKDVTVEDVNNALKEAVDNPLYKGVLGVTDEPVVSSDFIGDPRSSIVDLPMTRVVGGNLVKVMAWYDNEWGYSNRLVEQVAELGAA